MIFDNNSDTKRSHDPLQVTCYAPSAGAQSTTFATMVGPDSGLSKRNGSATPADARRARQLLRDMWGAQLHRELERYAAGRLVSLGLDPWLAPDLLNEAVRLVLTGLKGGREGRHPRKKDLNDVISFFEYLRQVLKSLSTSVGRHHRCLMFLPLMTGDASQIEDALSVRWEPAAPVPAGSTPEIRDLRRELFRRLHERVPRRLRSIVKAWEREFGWTDSIPLHGRHRRYRAEVRQFARTILNEMGEEF